MDVNKYTIQEYKCKQMEKKCNMKTAKANWLNNKCNESEFLLRKHKSGALIEEDI